MGEYMLGGAWVIVIVPFFINSSESVGFEPNLEASNVIVSLVWLSNIRFSISALTKIHICSLILGSLIADVLFFCNGHNEIPCDLVCGVVDVRGTLYSRYRVGEQDVLEGTV